MLLKDAENAWALVIMKKVMEMLRNLTTSVTLYVCCECGLGMGLINERRLRAKQFDLILTIKPLPVALIHLSFQPQLVASLPYNVTLKTT
jgi:hypothetical protein